MRFGCRLFILLSACAFSASARDHFLTIGGGGSPRNNQISLERNVLFFQRALTDCGIRDPHHDIFFACGNDPAARDLQFIPQNVEPPRVNLLLAKVFGSDNELWQNYRPHELKNLQGPANRASVSQWFDTAGKRIADGDRLFIYFTGHGSGGQRNQPRNTTMDLWLDGGMPVREFAGLLDKLNPRVQVVLVMVQCHSGGFADVIFKGGIVGPELASAPRCGFFATWPERLAAGCTPDSTEENYREYSTWFWEALSGHTRTGKAIDKPDYDRDGHTSLAEAHAYVNLTSDTIDIPVCTSDVLLRQHSRTSDTKIPGLLAASSAFDKLIETATPDRRAVLEGLSKQLELTGVDRAAAARGLANKIDQERRTLDGKKLQMQRDAEPLKRQIRGAIIAKWPEMTNPWHPAVTKALNQDADKIIKAIETSPAYAKWDKLDKDIDETAEKSFDLERKWVKCQRFLYTAESVALAANLEKTASKLVQEKYKALRGSECGGLGE